MKHNLAGAFFLLSFFFIFQTAGAQLRLPLGNSDVRQALEKVLNDFPKDFANLKGEILKTDPQTVEYATLLEFKSAEENTIIQHSGRQPVYSWQALMHTAEDFEPAAKKFRSLYSQLKNITLTLHTDYSFSLRGEYEAPEESKRFCSVLFDLLPHATALPKVKVELSMQYELLQWKIYLLVYKKEREDDEKE